MADPDVLGFPRGQVSLKDPAMMTPDEIAALPRPQRDAILSTLPPEGKGAVYRSMIRNYSDADAEKANDLDALVAEEERYYREQKNQPAPVLPTGLMSASEAAPARMQRGAPIAEPDPTMVAQAGADAQAATEALMQNRPQAAAAPPAAVVPSGDPHTDYMRGVLGGQNVPFNGLEVMRLTEEQMAKNRAEAAKPLEQRGAEAFPITAGGQGTAVAQAEGGAAAAPAAGPAEKPMSDQERVLLDIILQYQHRNPEWNGSPGTAPDPVAKKAAEEAIRLELERQGKLAETHGGELAGATQAIADATEQAAQHATQYADEANRAQADRDLRSKGYEAAIRRAQDDLERESASVDPGRMLHGGRGVLIAIAAGLGAFGAAMTKTPNFAQHILDEALDRDFQVQKDRVGIKQGQVSKAQEIYNSFRLKGMEEAAAKAATYGVVKEYFANHIQKLIVQKQSVAERQAGEAVQSSLRGKAEVDKQTAIIQEAAGKPAVPAHDILKEALERQKQMVEIARIQAEAEKSRAEAGQAGQPKPPSEDLVSKLADRFAAGNAAIENINEMLSLLRNGQVGPIGARMPMTAEHQRFDVLRRQSVEILARSFGAATTESDRKAAENIEKGKWWNLTTPQMVARLEALQASALRRQKTAMAGQDPRIVKMIQERIAAQQANNPAPQQSTADYSNIAGGHL